MAKKCPEPDCPKCLPGWLAAFGDLMSLLLCFFVLLLSMSSMDAKKVQDAIGSLSGALSVLEGGTKTEISKEQVQQATPMDRQDETAQTVKTISKALAGTNEMVSEKGSPKVTMDDAEKGFVVRLPSALLFQDKSTQIEDDDALLFIKRIALIIKKSPNSMHINVIGHTDDTEIDQNKKWETSTARAIAVLQKFLAEGINPKRFTVSGQADQNPVASNATPEGRSKNRRVELHFRTKNVQEKQAVEKNILDEKE
jgi:chemotaxis protein MotB